MLSIDPLSLDEEMLDEARAYLRLEQEEEDASLGAILLAAMAHAERYLGLLLLRRDVRETVPVSLAWQKLNAAPHISTGGATGIPAEGASFALSPGAYAVDVDARGEGWLRITQPGAAGRVELVYHAGLAASWSTLPEALRLGVLRLAAHLHGNRDRIDDAGPPAAVAALLRPWRRMRLS